jgi:hypothetical protein
MEKFTTKQLQNALVGLYKMKTKEAFDAYQMTFEEVEKRMGDDFDAWMDANLV